MNFTIKEMNSTDRKSRDIWLPAEEEKLQEICNDLEIRMTTATNCFIENVADKKLGRLLNNKYCNIDELNYLLKRMDGFNKDELATFYAAALAENEERVSELINLTFNTHRYCLVSDFEDLEKAGRDLYLSKKIVVSQNELDEFNGEAYAMSVLRNNTAYTVTPYGVLFLNRNAHMQVYNGMQFPQYEWKESILTVELKSNGESEYVYLPCSDIEIKKALIRLDVSDIKDCGIDYDNHCIPKKILDIIAPDEFSMIELENLNNFAKHYKGMGKETWRFDKLVSYVNPCTNGELLELAESMHEFELFDGIKNAEGYGKYLVCESGNFEYDQSLEKYIDFKGYGEDKLACVNSAFTKMGCIIYHGCNQESAGLLFENLGMVIPEGKKLKTLKLYMPITVRNYDSEYVDEYDMDVPTQIPSREIADFLDEIIDEIEKDEIYKEKRGLMKYYDVHDSINAKVSKYLFSLEKVGEEPMGVAILTLNDALMPDELEMVKNVIIDQAADGWGKAFENRDIDTCIGEVNIGFFNRSMEWFLKTAEEMELSNSQVMGGMKLE